MFSQSCACLEFQNQESIVLISYLFNLQGGAKRMDSPIFKSGDYNFNLIASIW